MYRLVTLSLPPSWHTAPDDLPMTSKIFKEQFKPVKVANPLVPSGLDELIEQCMRHNENNSPERMSVIQGTLDQLADEAAAKLDDPAAIED